MRNPPARLRRWLSARRRLRAQRRLEMMEAVNAGMVGGPHYKEVAERLIAIAYPEHE